MSETANLAKPLELIREYSTPYAALIRADVVMGVPRYFLERWVPVLGTNAATVVNTLRQLNYHCDNDNLTISGTALAREASMSRRHLYTCLDTAWMQAFIRTKSGQKIRNKDGKITQNANTYWVRMDDPLTPADADHLCQILTKLADTPLDAAQRALELDPRDLWAPDAKHPPERFTLPHAITARDVLQRAFPLWTPPTEMVQRTFAQCAEALHRHITLVRDDGKTSKIIVPQYFRKRWWKQLGHDLAWAYLWLRGYVYDKPDEGIRRDICWIPSLDTLLAVINRPREWWRRNVESRKPNEAWSLDAFFIQRATQKGRDPTNPQWVARQFWIALDIPVTPGDQAQYERLLNTWQSDSILTGSATNKHTGNPQVSHIRAHRQPTGEPQMNTPATHRSATNEHTGPDGVCHIRAQGSATSAHRDSESNKATIKNHQYQNNNKHQPPSAEPSPKTNIAGGAAEIEIDDSFKHETLLDQIEESLDNLPETPLYKCAAIEVWLQQTWLEPIRPHTPAWNAIKTGQVSSRDMVALMLAIWADTAIKQPPRYLSWLIQRWQKQPDVPPVAQWKRWQTLADVPIGQWADRGRREWLELVPHDNRALPFGLDVLLGTVTAVRESLLQLATRQAEVDEFNARRAQAEKAQKRENLTNAPTGLDERPGNGSATISDIWQATLGQISAQINRATYQEWVEGTRAVSYTKGVLTVQAKHGLARDWLAQQLNASIEATASALANMPITIRYIS